MTDFSATDAAFTGIRFVRERPRTVAVWAGLQIVISLVLGGIVIAVMGPELAQLQGFGRQPQPIRRRPSPPSPASCRCTRCCCQSPC